MSRHDTAKGFAALHSRDRLAADGTPAFTERFLFHLDRHVAVTREDAPTDDTQAALTLGEACARLQAERPVWWEVIELCCRRGLKERAAAAVVGVSQALVHRRKVAGLGLLAIWCALDVDDVAHRLATLATRHG